MDKPNPIPACGIDDFTLPALACGESRRIPSESPSPAGVPVRRPGGCHALRAPYRPAPAGASAEDWLKAMR